MIQIFLIALLSLTGTTDVTSPWMLDMENAKKKAQIENKNILIYFSGSDWCKPCIQLKNDIIETPEFQNYVDEHLVMVLADFPRKKKNRLSKDQMKKNEALAEKYNLDGYFPLIAIADAEGNLKGRMGFEKISVEEYIQILDQIMTSL